MKFDPSLNGRKSYGAIANFDPIITSIASFGMNALVRSNNRRSCNWFTIDQILANEEEFTKFDMTTTPTVEPTADFVPVVNDWVAVEGTSVHSPFRTEYAIFHNSQ